VCTGCPLPLICCATSPMVFCNSSYQPIWGEYMTDFPLFQEGTLRELIDPTTRATEISTLTTCGQCYAPKRTSDRPTHHPTAFALSFRSASVPHSQGRISSAPPWCPHSIPQPPLLACGWATLRFAERGDDYRRSSLFLIRIFFSL
jgi:hypothetical protein